MSLPVLLLLPLLILQCGGCNFDWDAVKNIQATIKSNPTGFRTVFPKDYYVEHHYKSAMLCETDQCCVFSAAVVLLDSWNVLIRNLWDEHLNHSFILDLKQTLDKIIQKNRHTTRFQEETDLFSLPNILSSPEDLLKLTSELFSRWLEVGCMTSIETCSPPTLSPFFFVREDYGPSRARLLTTHAVEGQRDQMFDETQPPSNGSPLSLPFPVSLWSPMLLGLCWWLLP